MPLSYRSAHDDVRHLACDACGWTTGDLATRTLPSQVWHAFELDHDDTSDGCTPIVPEPQLRARYEQAFATWAALYATADALPLPFAHRLRLAS